MLDFVKNALINMSDCSKKMVFLTLCLLLAGCSHDPSRVTITDLRGPARATAGQHIVKRGETLYSIAWLYQRDFRELAASNGIASPYTIYPGQKISLTSRRLHAVKPYTPPAARKPPPRPVVNAAPKVVNKPAKVVSERKKDTPVKKQPAPTPTVDKAVTSSSGWRWPVNGRVISGYSLKMPINKGIDISGKLGEPVAAAASGEVVYAGSDLSGYGRLIILKHNSSYLSAYAHNRELFVNEGDSVKAGQKIAEVGSTGTTEPKLHFEIRRDGKPVDPMGYLPQRR